MWAMLIIHILTFQSPSSALKLGRARKAPLFLSAEGAGVWNEKDCWNQFSKLPNRHRQSFLDSKDNSTSLHLIIRHIFTKILLSVRHWGHKGMYVYKKNHRVCVYMYRLLRAVVSGSTGGLRTCAPQIRANYCIGVTL